MCTFVSGFAIATCSTGLILVRPPTPSRPMPSPPNSSFAALFTCGDDYIHNHCRESDSLVASNRHPSKDVVNAYRYGRASPTCCRPAVSGPRSFRATRLRPIRPDILMLASCSPRARLVLAVRHPPPPRNVRCNACAPVHFKSLAAKLMPSTSLRRSMSFMLRWSLPPLGR